MKTMTTLALAAAALMAVTAAADASGGNDRLRYRCRAKGSVDISMQARYEVRGTGTTARKRFDAEFEAAQGLGFIDGTALDLEVAGVVVDHLLLDGVSGGDLVVEVEYRSRAGIENPPFPANFPTNVGLDSEVNFLKDGAVVLGCALQ